MKVENFLSRNVNVSNVRSKDIDKNYKLTKLFLAKRLSLKLGQKEAKNTDMLKSYNSYAISQRNKRAVEDTDSVCKALRSAKSIPDNNYRSFREQYNCKLPSPTYVNRYKHNEAYLK